MKLPKSLNNLIFADQKSGKDEPKEKYVSKFPETSGLGSTFPTPSMEASSVTTAPVPTMSVPLECAPHMEKIMKLYEDGFASLNKPGVEFYEFFEAIVEAGMNDPAAYKMALKILSKNEKTMTKDSLIGQSQYYIDELTKVHAGYKTDGIKMKNELMGNKESEGNKLKIDIKTIQDQIESMKNQLTGKQAQLSQIDAKYQPKIGDLDCKMMANDEAKNRILGTINNVVNGIRTNL